ncbi:LOW QUALITY PROTEIN: deubiquitinase MYSM1-like [Babylonia areolata]|uniref:LOW QUALITY PROTEIN: deubiquitinase MYSM1-like n=1 Tax=Babylonia areolata TaxID=304850 RepID=UPI003FD48A84
MADDDIDVEGDFNFKLESGGGLYDANELPSKSANLLPEFTNPPWMLEQGWVLDNGMDEKSKATIEKMLLEEQQYINGRKKGKYLGINKSVLLITAPSQPQKRQETSSKQQWTEEEKELFVEGLEKFGHSWSKISQLIPSRTSVQVKNYAKQFFKTKAKGVTQAVSDPNLPAPVSPVSPSDDVFASAATVMPSTSCFTDVEYAVSTARPTIIARSHPPVKGRPKSGKKKAVSAGKSRKRAVTCATVGARSLLDPTHLTSAPPSINGFESTQIVQASLKEEKRGPLFRLLPSQASTSALQTSTVIECTGDSESEVDIDIENDDEGENTILQSRSTSPSSVYNRLLAQAKGAVRDKPSHEQDVFEDEDDCPDQPVPDSRERNRGEEHSAEQSGCAGSSWGSSSVQQEREGEWVTGGGVVEEEPGALMEQQVAEGQEVKHIVNGVTASGGEIFEFPIPIEDRELHTDSITDEEKMVHTEFFDGRPLKTPERYLKIRNYILDCWKKSRPSYLNKTSVRPGLKNCGDVNCIGRIHAYLECIGAINFGCEQASYNNPGRGMTTLPKLRHLGKAQHTVLSVAKLDAMRPRKRRIRDASGLWVDEKELEGKTIEHKPEEEDPSRLKSGRNRKVVYDPFKLVPCQLFSQDKQAPFQLEVMSTAMAVMDIHAHISRTEVIGMLGGRYDEGTSCLTISMAIPCKSISTGMQCEMDPVSQTHASEQIEDVGMRVVGWYHSHPTFAPSPSVRDIETQQKFQYWFAKGGNHFVGLIISPYSPHNNSVVSDIRCLTISDEVAKEYLCNTPYQFSYSMVYRDNMREILGPASELAEKYATYSSRVGLSCVYKSSLGITCLSKMLQSVKHRLEPPEEKTIHDHRRKVDDVLHWLEQIFIDKFSSSSSSSSASTADIKITPTTSAIPPSDEDVQV